MVWKINCKKINSLHSSKIPVSCKWKTNVDDCLEKLLIFRIYALINRKQRHSSNWTTSAVVIKQDSVITIQQQLQWYCTNRATNAATARRLSNLERRVNDTVKIEKRISQLIWNFQPTHSSVTLCAEISETCTNWSLSNYRYIHVKR